MAKKKSYSKARALQPAVMKLHFRVPVDETGQALRQYVDLSECTSRVNRRFMRQGLNWAVANVKLSLIPAATPGVTPGVAYVNCLQHTWTTANAWMKAFSLWKKQQDDALENSDSLDTAARFRDFKVFADTDHVTATFANNLDPYTLGPGTIIGPLPAGIQTGATVLPSEEWLSSEIVVPNDGAPGVTNQYELHMIGGNLGNSKGIIQGYADSRNVPTSPDPTTPTISLSWMQQMFDVGDDSTFVTNNAQNRNDELPYDQLDYPGSGTNFDQLECQGYVLNNSSIGALTFNTGPFTAPCGLIRFDFAGLTTSNAAGAYNIITIELVPGNHRGYLCETMEDF